MNNLILHLISNRAGPFLEPLFGSNPKFVPTVPPAGEIELRKAMYLDVTDTDYYLKIYLAVLNAYPDWKQQFGYNLQESYRPEEVMPKGVYINGGDFSAAGNTGIGAYLGLPANTLPVELHYQIAWVSDSSCQISGVYTGIRLTAAVSTSGSDPDKVLRVIWPSQIPFTGPIQLNQEWGEGALIDIFVQPSRFPFPDLVSRLQSNAYLQNLLMSYGISAPFNEDKDPMEQTAMALTVLGLTNQARIVDRAQSQRFSINAIQPGWLTESAS